MNELENIEGGIKEFIAKNLLFSPEGFPYSDDASFLQAGIIDSLGVMELVTFVNNAHGITVDQQEVTPQNFDSVGNLAAFVRGKLQTVSSGPSLQTGS